MTEPEPPVCPTGNSYERRGDCEAVFHSQFFSAHIFDLLPVLFCLRAFASPVFAPGMFLLGILFACPAESLEEIGWMGFAFPGMSRAWSPLFASIVLGWFWSRWHLPDIDYLATATPHGAYKLHYFLAFPCAMTAMRVVIVIAWLYSNTASVFVSRLPHASSTSALVVFSPPRVTAGQEARWHFAYGALLGLGVAILGVGWDAIWCDAQAGQNYSIRSEWGSLAVCRSSPPRYDRGEAAFRPPILRLTSL